MSVGKRKVSFPHKAIIIKLSSLNNVVYLFYYTALGENSAKRIKRINRCIFSDNRTRIKYAAASDIGVVAKYSAYLAKSRFVLNVAVNHDILSVRLKI